MRATNQSQRKKNNINQNVYKKILENVRDAFLVAQDGKTKYANVKMLELLGYDSEEELVGKEFKNFIHPDDYQRVLSNHQRRLRGEQFESVYEFNLLRKNGEPVPVEIRVAILEWEGRPATLNFLIDIASRKQADKELRESEAKYRNLYSFSALGIFHSTFEGRFIDINPALAKMLGYDSPEEAVSLITSISEQVYADPPIRDSVADEALKAGGFINVTNSYRRRDGSLWYGRLHLRVVPDQQGRPSHYEGFVEDITEHKQAEEELRQNRNMLDQVLNTIPQSVFWKDRDSRYLGCNLQFARAAGLENTDKIVGKTDFDLPWPGEEAVAYRNDDRFVMDNNLPKPHIIEPLQQADGSRLSVDTSKMPLIDGQGGVYGVLGIYEDITERQQAEQTLRLHGEIMTHISEGIILTRVKDNIIVYVNPKMEEMFGYGAGELIGKHNSILNAPREKSSGGKSQKIVSCLQKHEMWQGEVNCRKKDRTLFWCSANISKFHHAEHGNVLVAIYSNITERKSMIEELESSYRQLRVLNQRWVEIEELERKRLSAELHDELGQNLTALGINFGIVKMNLPPATASLVYNRIDDSLNLLKRSSVHVKNIMSNLRPALLDDYGLVPALRWYAQDIVKRTGIEISCAAENLPSRLPTEIETALFRIAQEAINNSVKHAEAKSIVLNLNYAENRLHLVIADDGVGFDTQVTSGEDFPGWGLMIIKERSVGIKGICRIESNSGRGTEISIEVPL